jgi:hypothetical protein
MMLEDLIQKWTVKVNDMPQEFGRQVADKITKFVIERIQNRTIRGGYSYQGNKYLTHSQSPMNPYYSQIWGKQRQKAGKTVQIRNYYYTGEMLGSIRRTKFMIYYGTFEMWFQGTGIHKRNKGTIPNRELLTIHSNDQNVNLLGLNPDDLKRLAKELELKMEIYLR